MGHLLGKTRGAEGTSSPTRILALALAGLIWDWGQGSHISMMLHWAHTDTLCCVHSPRSVVQAGDVQMCR